MKNLVLSGYLKDSVVLSKEVIDKNVGKVHEIFLVSNDKFKDGKLHINKLKPSDFKYKGAVKDNNKILDFLLGKY